MKNEHYSIGMFAAAGLKLGSPAAEMSMSND
jgi:hypothetical protein